MCVGFPYIAPTGLKLHPPASAVPGLQMCATLRAKGLDSQQRTQHPFGDCFNVQ